LLSSGLAACVTTTPGHNMSAESVRALRLERVEVNVGPPGQVTWAGLIEDVMAAEGKRTGREVADPLSVGPQAKAEPVLRSPRPLYKRRRAADLRRRLGV
jgi:hypothetical protein